MRRGVWGAAPLQEVTGFAVDDLREVLGVTAALELVGVVERLSEPLVDGMEDLPQLGALGTAVMKGVAGPDPVAANEAAGVVELDDAVLVALPGIEHGRREHEVRHRVAHAEEASR